MKDWRDLPRSLGLILGTKGKMLIRAMTRFMGTILVANYRILAQIRLSKKGIIVVHKYKDQGEKPAPLWVQRLR